MKPQPTLERIWLCYLAAVAAVAALAPGGGSPGHRAGAFLALHAVVLVLVLATRSIALRRSHVAARWWRVALAIGGLPVVFSALAWLLPGVHPEPYEYTWLAVDRSCLGTDVARLGDGWLQPWVCEVQQVVYGLFYFVPIVAALGARWHSGPAAFDRAVVILVGGFLASYLGYLLVPTLAPKLVLAFPTELEGLWLFPLLRHSIDAAEVNPWDCFPSGHTMLTLTSLGVLWRWNRRLFWVMLVPGSVLVLSTMMLRYHWAVDVAVGAALAWPALCCCDRLMDRDGWPVAPAAPAVTPA